MSVWKIKPAEAHAVLREVTAAGEELATELTETKFQSVLDGLTWGGPITAAVGGAVGAVLADQTQNLNTIANRINAGTVGVANAVIAYNNGQEEMAGSYQTELLRSAQTGDFTYFAAHGHQG